MSPPPGIFISVLRWCAVAVLTIVLLGTGILVGLFSPKKAFLLCRIWARISLRVFRIEVLVRDENQGAYPSHGNLYVTLNQTTGLESFFGPARLPTDFGVIVNLAFVLVPVIGWFNFVIGGILVVPGRPGQIARAMRKATAFLKKEGNLWISIEGRRSPDGRLLPYKKGTARLAVAAQATVVPIFYESSRERLPFGEWRVRPGRVVLHIFKSIPVGSFSGTEDELTLRLRALAESKIRA